MYVGYLYRSVYLHEPSIVPTALKWQCPPNIPAPPHWGSLVVEVLLHARERLGFCVRIIPAMIVSWYSYLIHYTFVHGLAWTYMMEIMPRIWMFWNFEIYTANTYILYIYIHIRHIMITKITILQCHWWLGMTRFINQDYEDPENFPVCSHSLNLDLESKTTTAEIQTFIQTLLLGSCWVWYAIEYRCFPDWNLSLRYLGYHILPVLVYLVVLVWLRTQGNWAVAGYARVILLQCFSIWEQVVFCHLLVWDDFRGWSFQAMLLCIG